MPKGGTTDETEILRDEFKRLATQSDDLFHVYLFAERTAHNHKWITPCDDIPSSVFDLASSYSPLGAGVQIVEASAQWGLAGASVYLAPAGADIVAMRKALATFRGAVALTWDKYQRPTKPYRAGAVAQAIVCIDSDGNPIPGPPVPSTSVSGISRFHDLFWLDFVYERLHPDLTTWTDGKTEAYRLRALPCDVFRASVLALAPIASPGEFEGYAKPRTGTAAKPEGTPIDPENRTAPMSLRRAAKLIGKTGSAKDAAEWLKASIEDGSYLAQRVTRQNWVFDKSQFPKNVWHLILP